MAARVLQPPVASTLAMVDRPGACVCDRQVCGAIQGEVRARPARSVLTVMEYRRAEVGARQINLIPSRSKYDQRTPRPWPSLLPGDHSRSIAWYIPVSSSAVPQILCEAWC